LAAIAVMSIGLVSVSEVWSTTARRQKLVELEWIGAQFTEAIGSYYQSSTGLTKTYPPSLQDLLEDRRYAVPRRHLRAVYRNPFTGKADWELVNAVDGKIRGIRVSVPGEGGGQTREFLYLPSG
jgi:type II secretory pathway pseudopilin PulG